MPIWPLKGRFKKACVLAAAGLALALGLSTLNSAPAADSLAGQLLVAQPSLADPLFSQTLIYMLHHDASGAQGLVVNRPLGRMPLARLLQALGSAGDRERPGSAPPKQNDPAEDAASLPVFYGGPVEPSLGFTLHSRDKMLVNSLPVGDKIALNLQDEALRALAAGAGPRQMIFHLGYAGWGPGQLENELARGDWDVMAADLDLIFSDDPAGSWERAWARRSTDL